MNISILARLLLLHLLLFTVRIAALKDTMRNIFDYDLPLDYCEYTIIACIESPNHEEIIKLLRTKEGRSIIKKQKQKPLNLDKLKG